MKEVEILVKVLESKQSALNKLKKFNSKGIHLVKDIYFYHPNNKKLKVNKESYPKDWLRIRAKNNKYFLTYKIDHLTKNNKWSHSDEFETEIKNKEVLLEILKKLGFKKLIEINNKKHIFLTKDFEIVLEEVKNLGLFLEVEKLNVPESANISKIRKEILNLINSLNLKISKELHLGKPELMLKKEKKKF